MHLLLGRERMRRMHGETSRANWQGTLQAGKSLRIILKITKTDKG
jgi:hypothetical protein